MGNKDFDDILLVLKGEITFTGATLVSLEIDFEMPRGMIAKIKFVEMKVKRISLDFLGISVDKEAQYQLALIKDPDDNTSAEIPNNSVDHDVLMEHEVDIHIVAGTAGDTIGNIPHDAVKIMDFSMADVFVARNMRLNGDGLGADGGDLTEAQGVANVYYTLEEVKNKDIVQILGIE